MNENKYASRDLLVRGIAAAKCGDEKEARFFLEWFLSQDPPINDRNDAFYYLYKIAEDNEEKFKFIHSILETDPLDVRARRELAILNGDLKQEDMVDPDRLVAQKSVTVKNNPGERFVCPKCGGRMTYTPDGQSLTCEQCEAQSASSKKKSGVKDENFIIALATAKGHSNAVNTQVLVCQGCSAEFIVPPRQLSWQCPFCESNYAIEQVEERQIISPNSLIPFYVSQKEASGILNTWMEDIDSEEHPTLRSLQGIFLPVWTFDVGGEISWQVEVKENKKWVLKKDIKSLFLDDICVTATNKWQEWMEDLLATYDLKQLVPFETGYLANWVAETYEIQAGDAALDAREIALKHEKQLIRDYSMLPVRGESVNSTRMTVEQYKLILIPVWSGILQIGQRQIQALINGQNGKLVTPSANGKGISGWISKFFGV